MAGWQRLRGGLYRSFHNGVEVDVAKLSDGSARWAVRGHVEAYGKAANLEQAKAVAAELAEALSQALGEWKARVSDRTA